MPGLLLALQFLTVIPLRISNVNEKKLGVSLIYFPIVGLLIGLFLTGINNLLFFAGFPEFVTNIILVVSLVILTGGMHLDGLSDTFDSIFSVKGKDEILRIMRDPHAGAMGVLSIICVLLLKISFLSCINPVLKNPALIIMCISSRWAMVFAMRFFPYARQEGKARIYMQNMNANIFIMSTAIAIACLLVIGNAMGVLVFVFVAVFAALCSKFVTKKISGITGDTLGALCELCEVVVLLYIIIMAKIL